MLRTPDIRKNNTCDQTTRLRHKHWFRSAGPTVVRGREGRRCCWNCVESARKQTSLAVRLCSAKTRVTGDGILGKGIQGGAYLPFGPATLYGDYRRCGEILFRARLQFTILVLSGRAYGALKTGSRAKYLHDNISGTNGLLRKNISRTKYPSG